MLQVVWEFIADVWDAGPKSIPSREWESRDVWVLDWILINSSPIPFLGSLGSIRITLYITGESM